jgi:hypothetical protein
LLFQHVDAARPVRKLLVIADQHQRIVLGEIDMRQRGRLGAVTAAPLKRNSSATPLPRSSPTLAVL